MVTVVLARDDGQWRRALRWQDSSGRLGSIALQLRQANERAIGRPFNPQFLVNIRTWIREWWERLWYQRAHELALELCRHARTELDVQLTTYGAVQAAACRGAKYSADAFRVVLPSEFESLHRTAQMVSRPRDVIVERLTKYGTERIAHASMT